MKFFRFCCRKSCDKDADPVYAKMQENVASVVQPCNGKRSASSVGIIKSEGSQSAAKIVRLELDVSTSNTWDLPINMVEYLNKYIHIHIPDVKGCKREKFKGQYSSCQGTPGSWQLY